MKSQMSKTEAAKLTGVSRNTIKNWIEQGRLKVEESDGKIMVDREDLKKAVSMKGRSMKRLTKLGVFEKPEPAKPTEELCTPGQRDSEVSTLGSISRKLLIKIERSVTEGNYDKVSINALLLRETAEMIHTTISKASKPTSIIEEDEIKDFPE